MAVIDVVMDFLFIAALSTLIFVGIARVVLLSWLNKKAKLYRHGR